MVNLETEAVLECSTQTEREGDDGEGGGHLFYIPLPEGPLVNSQLAAAPQQLIQGVAVKLDTEGPDQRVIMRAKLITKPPTTFGSTPRSLVAGGKVKPEQKVRPLGSAALTTEPNATSIAPTVTSSGTVSAVKPPPVVGTVQPTVRRSSGATVDQSTGTAVKQTTQATQADSLPAKPVRRESVHLPPPLPPPLSVKPTKSRQVGVDSGLNRGKSISPSNTLVAVGSAHFPKCGTPPCLVEAPTFRPTEKEFHDPLEYIDRITPLAQQFGICRIIPPPNFKVLWLVLVVVEVIP
ncbi:hypothetical protein AAG570_011888 [Ranatra chinensis]|uniref:JmjN domain-containing protein n=1 Tax=Ranatra chinensis TaxID=642074 RepID=A0ABD0YH73_9HEMI